MRVECKLKDCSFTELGVNTILILAAQNRYLTRSRIWFDDEQVDCELPEGKNDQIMWEIGSILVILGLPLKSIEYADEEYCLNDNWSG